MKIWRISAFLFLAISMTCAGQPPKETGTPQQNPRGPHTVASKPDSLPGEFLLSILYTPYCYPTF